MKKIFVALSCAMFAFMANAQDFQFGVEAGYDHSFWKYKQEGQQFGHRMDASGKDGLDGFHIGPVVKYNFDENIALRAGLFYHYAGTCEEISSFDGESWSKPVKIGLREQNLQLPINFMYTWNINDKIGLFGFVGPKLDFGLALKEVEKDQDVKFNMYNGNVRHDGEKVSDYDVEGSIDRFDVKVNFGVGVNFCENFYAQIGADFGLLNRYKKDDVDNAKDGGFDKWKMNNNSLQLSVGYYF